LLDHNLYEVQERPKTTITGSLPMNTYFVLYKKDRLGATRSRPYHLVLKEMKRQEIEDAKIKQSTSLKRESIQNPPLKENGFNRSMIPTTESIEISSPVNIDNGEYKSFNFIRNSLSKPKSSNDQQINTSELIGDPRYSKKSQRKQSRSRTCELI
jgi:hypothetical protein